MNAWIKKLKCPECGGAVKSLPGKGVWKASGVKCVRCRAKYPVKNGILEMLPQGDYSRYEYWNANYPDSSGIIESYKKRFSYTDKFLLNYYTMPALAMKLGWKKSDIAELGCGWGTNALAMSKFGLARETWLVDISRQALKGAAKVHAAFGNRAYPVRTDIHRLPFKDNAFGVSLSGGLYEHFTGAEQEALIKENCRISKKVLCQVPWDNPTYWLYRWAVTVKNGFKWPFGFEAPVKRKKIISLYEGAGARFKGEDYGNLATSLIILSADKGGILKSFDKKPRFFRLFAHDIVIAVEK